MGVLGPSIENDLIDIIRQDLSERMTNIIIKNNFNKNILIGPYKRTLIQICAYYGSVKCLKNLINMNYDINELEGSNNNSPLFIACKFDYLEIVYLLLNNNKQECLILRKNIEGLNEFEVAFLRGNYEICYYLLYEYKKTKLNNYILNLKDNEIIENKEEKQSNTIINTHNIKEKEIENEYEKFFNDINFCLEKYLGIQEYLSYPLFNMPLFYKCLKEKIIPRENPSFEAERKKTKEILTKIPDPNETWGNFMKRLTRLELYNPPLVDKNTFRKANSLYMNTQMKIISLEYGIKMDYCNPENLNINYNIINKNEEKVLLNVNKEEKIDDEVTKNENDNNYMEENDKQSDKKYFNINLRKNINKKNTEINKKLKNKNSKINIYNKFNIFNNNENEVDSEKKAISFTISDKNNSNF